MSKVVTNGIEFGNVANAGTNVLDWYEEGVWTPTFNGASGSMGNTVVSSSYTRIGRNVNLHATFTLGSTWTAGTGGIMCPPPAAVASTTQTLCGIVGFYKASTGSYWAYMWRPIDGMMFQIRNDGVVATPATVSIPFTFAIGDFVTIAASYQIV